MVLIRWTVARREAAANAWIAGGSRARLRFWDAVLDVLTLRGRV